MQRKTLTLNLTLLFVFSFITGAWAGSDQDPDLNEGLIKICRKGKCIAYAPNGAQICVPCPRRPPPSPQPTAPTPGCFPCLNGCTQDGHCL